MNSCKIVSHLLNNMVGDGRGVGWERLGFQADVLMEVGVSCHECSILVVLYYSCVSNVVSYRDVKGSLMFMISFCIVSFLIVE